jgi:hypothetical protein
MNAISPLAGVRPQLFIPLTPFRLIVDFETFYSREFSLSKITPLQYILDPQFEVIGASVRIDVHDIGAESDSANRPFTTGAQWFERDALAALLRTIPWERVALVSHNIQFDGAILAWIYGYVPALYMDTLGMSRALVYPYTGRASLEATAKYLSLPPKQKDVIVNALGWRLEHFRADEAQGGQRYRAYREYCEHDSDLCAGILDKLAPQMPREEILMMDMLARMAIQPQFALDRDVLDTHLKTVKGAKEKLLTKLRDSGLIAGSESDKDARKPKELMSDEKLAGLLRNLGVDPPTKISAKTKEEVYAFAKTDAEFTALQEDDNPLVQALVTARLGVKTTIEETRTERFLGICDVEWPEVAQTAMLPAAKRSPLDGTQPLCMPFPLKYSGAHTHRFSGDWKLNLQNLGRKSPLRKALVAPPGYKVVSADASQIEARVVCWLAGATKVLNDFRNKNDPYLRLAERIYGRPLNKDDNPDERFVGKTGVLGLGFGMGEAKFVVTCWNQGRKVIELDLSKKTVRAYRKDYAPEVPELWSKADYLIDCMITGQPMRLGPIQAIGQRLLLPNGMWLHYNKIRREMRPSPWAPEGSGRMANQAMFEFGNELTFLFGGKLVENMVQALARIITMSAALRIRRKWGIRFPLAGQIHDQLIYIVPDSDAKPFLNHVLVPEMRLPLDWCPDLPLDAEGAIGQNLLEAK